MHRNHGMHPRTERLGVVWALIGNRRRPRLFPTLARTATTAQPHRDGYRPVRYRHAGTPEPHPPEAGQRRCSGGHHQPVPLGARLNPAIQTALHLPRLERFSQHGLFAYQGLGGYDRVMKLEIEVHEGLKLALRKRNASARVARPPAVTDSIPSGVPLAGNRSGTG
jgi:hypothetical protein